MVWVMIFGFYELLELFSFSIKYFELINLGCCLVFVYFLKFFQVILMYGWGGNLLMQGIEYVLGDREEEMVEEVIRERQRRLGKIFYLKRVLKFVLRLVFELFSFFLF